MTLPIRRKQVEKLVLQYTFNNRISSYTKDYFDEYGNPLVTDYMNTFHTDADIMLNVTEFEKTVKDILSKIRVPTIGWNHILHHWKQLLTKMELDEWDFKTDDSPGTYTYLLNNKNGTITEFMTMRNIPERHYDDIYEQFVRSRRLIRNNYERIR